MKKEISELDQSYSHSNQMLTVPSRLQILRVLLPKSLLERVCGVVNRVLRADNKPLCSAEELLGIIILHALSASYKESPTTLCSPSQREFFYDMKIKSERYYDVWRALSGSFNGRNMTEHHLYTWSMRNSVGNDLILQLEEEISSINRRILYVPGATINSLDDDHFRLSSKSVSHLTQLSVINNPKKALGPVSNAICSAMNPFLIVCHHS